MDILKNLIYKAVLDVHSPGNCTLLPKKLYEEDGEVMPTMKVKRKHINPAFKDLIEAMEKD